MVQSSRVTNKTRVTIYWLLPAKAETELFRRLIRILADEFDAAVFQPHLTLCSHSSETSPARLLRQIKAKPLRLRVRGIAHSSKFTKTLFVRFAADKSLARLIEGLGEKSKTLSDPHLSLLYKKLPAAMRRELAATLDLPFREVTFDSVAAVSCVAPTKTSNDVRSWRKLAAMRLTG
jgi:hypothetical protein